MGSTADMCGIVKNADDQSPNVENNDPFEMLKRAFSEAYTRGFDDQIRRIKFLLEASGKDLGGISKTAQDEPVEDKAETDEVTEEAAADEIADQDELADALIEQLLEAIEDPSIVGDEDRESVLESANTFEDEELKEGKKTASVSELVEARLKQYFDMFGWEV